MYGFRLACTGTRIGEQLAHRDKSFTVNIIPHDANRTRREWIITGKKLLLFRVAIALFVLSLTGSILLLSIGTNRLSMNAELSRRNSALSDSLRASLELNARLDEIEDELEEIRTQGCNRELATEGSPGGYGIRRKCYGQRRLIQLD